MPCMGRVVITIKRSSEHTAGLVLRKSVIVAISNPSDYMISLVAMGNIDANHAPVDNTVELFPMATIPLLI